MMPSAAERSDHNLLRIVEHFTAKPPGTPEAKQLHAELLAEVEKRGLVGKRSEDIPLPPMPPMPWEVHAGCEKWEQVGPCVYCVDHRERLYQGSLPASRDPGRAARQAVCAERGHDRMNLLYWVEAEDSWMKARGFMEWRCYCNAEVRVDWSLSHVLYDTDEPIGPDQPNTSSWQLTCFNGHVLLVCHEVEEDACSDTFEAPTTAGIVARLASPDDVDRWRQYVSPKPPFAQSETAHSAGATRVELDPIGPPRNEYEPTGEDA